jgi:hypothetical protein
MDGGMVIFSGISEIDDGDVGKATAADCAFRGGSAMSLTAVGGLPETRTPGDGSGRN